jgi:hypothetical protein
MGRELKRAGALLVLAACVVAVAAGCGGGSKNTTTQGLNAPLSPYERAMLRLGGSLNLVLTQIGQANRTAKGPKPVEANLLKSQRDLRAAAAKLAKIVPPANVKVYQQQLVKGVNDYADELTGVIAQLRAGVGPRALAVIPNLKGLREMSVATTKIVNAGYVITISSS